MRKVNRTDWWCTTCKFTIFASKNSCGQCGQRRPDRATSAPTMMKKKKNDWWCSTCKFTIFARKDSCGKCGRRRPTLEECVASSTPTPSPVVRSSKLKPERTDWWCTTCKFTIFGHKNSCGKCGMRRPTPAALAPPASTIAGLGPVGIAMVGGWATGGMPLVTSATTAEASSTSTMDESVSWACSKCTLINEPLRKVCSICSHVREEDDAPVRAGDWHCGMCNSFNFAKREFCFTCRTPYEFASTARKDSALSPAQLALVSGRGKEQHKALQFQPGDWLCVWCTELNWGSRVCCRGCGKDRPKPHADETDDATDVLQACVICTEEHACMAIISCGHLVLCSECSGKVDKCPMCRTEFTAEHLLRVFSA